MNLTKLLNLIKKIMQIKSTFCLYFNNFFALKKFKISNTFIDMLFYHAKINKIYISDAQIYD